MIFTSFNFIVFLSAVLLAYYLLPRICQPWLILAANVVFFACSGWQGLIFVAFTCISVWYAGKRINEIIKDGTGDLKAGKRKWMVFAVLSNIAILAFFKCTAVMPDGLFGMAMPMGISFYTFKALSHVIDAYRSKAPDASRECPLRVALFVSWFPEIVQGPISRFGELGATLFEPHSFDAAPFAQGFRRVCYGYFKKLVVADRLFPAILIITASQDGFNASYILLAIFLYMVALYADFTGGIDITIGTALMMGVRVTENFNSPYFAKSIMDYWRRWHITMGAWFRTYLFYPLNSSKALSLLTRPVKKLLGSKAAAQANMVIVTMVVWLAIGAWHGASWNFVAWGVANGVAIVIHLMLMSRYEKYAAVSLFAKTKLFGAVQIVLTFILMSFINSFDLYGMEDLFRSFGRIFSSELLSAGFLSSGTGEIGLSPADCAAAALGVAAMILVGVLSRGVLKGREYTAIGYMAQCGILCIATLVFGCYGPGYEARQFIYNQF